MAIDLIHPLFFSDGMNCFGLVNEFKFDISTYVHSRQLMHDGESVKDLVQRLREKTPEILYSGQRARTSL